MPISSVKIRPTNAIGCKLSVNPSMAAKSRLLTMFEEVAGPDSPDEESD